MMRLFGQDAPPPAGSVMPDFAREHLLGIGKVDILVAVPSDRNAGTIAGVAAAAGEALAGDFAGLRGLVLNADGDPGDSTPFVFNSGGFPEGVLRATLPYTGPTGRGNALRLVSEAAEIIRPSVCVVLDADLQEPDPSWVRRLAAPILAGTADLVRPIYAYRQFDDLAARLLAQPLAATLIAGPWPSSAAVDGAFSGELAVALRSEISGNPAAQGVGGDLWLSYYALLSGKRVLQLGPFARDRFARDPAVQLGPDFAQLAMAAFELLSAHAGRGRDVPAPPVLTEDEPVRELEAVDVTLPGLIARFKRGAATARGLWEQVLSPAHLAAALEIAAPAYKKEEALGFHFPPELWAGIVSDWLRVYQAQGLADAAVLAGLGPLFHGFAAGYVAAVRADPRAELELLAELDRLFRRIE